MMLHIKHLWNMITSQSLLHLESEVGVTEVDMDICADDIIDVDLPRIQVQVFCSTSCEVAIQSVPTITDAWTQTYEECDS